ncbi:hypothetical protein ONS95_001372 [Cadophora gregata]|uniref:uncharacterized protein n=1 Tax=Cadophora gregata TaxID=51156 RepID=UPI0026DAF92E|nr:uncharacterized protein ONS95_001372 [Cadophora gregata]KAK0110991.1 hypothetical protein ONS95_001372 [Cadophora gregata]
MSSVEGKFFSRFWSHSSAGGLVCGKGLAHRRELSFKERYQEFNDHHKHKDEPEPTALVSVSDKLSRTISGALRRCKHREERAEDVWIALIYVPHSEVPAPYHSAADLVWPEDKDLFRSEYLFDWEINEEYVAHVVSLRVLLDRGIERYIDLEADDTSSLEQGMWDGTKNLGNFDRGLYFAAIGRCFGARAPVQYFAGQLCVNSGRNCSALVRDGIETSIIDWWLADVDFATKLEIYNEEAGCMLLEIHEQMEVLEDEVFWLTIEAFERGESVSAGVLRRIASERYSLTEKLKLANEAIEREAIKIGL